MEDATIEIEPKEEGEEISIADLLKRLTDLEAAFGDYKKKMEEKPEEKEEEMAEEKKDDAALSRFESKLDQIISNFGAAPMKGSPAVEEKKDEKIDLKAIIDAKTSELGSRTAAIKFAMSAHPAEYIALRDSNQLNF